MRTMPLLFQKLKRDVGMDLDDLSAVRAADTSNILAQLGGWPEMFEDALSRDEKFELNPVYREIDLILIAGVGGSAIAGELASSWIANEIRVPIMLCRNYTLPALAGPKTLVIAVSYSGETDETLSCFMDAHRRAAPAIAVSAGGRLERYASKLQVPHLEIKKGLAPRVGLPYLFTATARILASYLPDEGGKKVVELKGLSDFLEGERNQYLPQSPSKQNPAKQLALLLRGRFPVIFAYHPFSSVAFRMKADFNENAKTPCKWEVLPELKHNEALGWSRPEAAKGFHAILLRDSTEDPLLGIDMENLEEQLLRDRFDGVSQLHAHGENLAERFFSFIYLGGYTSSYLGILNGVDPSRIDLITKLKEELRRKTNLIAKLDNEAESSPTL